MRRKAAGERMMVRDGVTVDPAIVVNRPRDVSIGGENK